MTPFDPSRIKRSVPVMRAVGCSIAQAYGMVTRVEAAGLSPDMVDWDAVQGSDLSYTERITLLEERLGRPLPTKRERALIERLASQQVPEDADPQFMMALSRDLSAIQ